MTSKRMTSLGLRVPSVRTETTLARGCDGQGGRGGAVPAARNPSSSRRRRGLDVAAEYPRDEPARVAFGPESMVPGDFNTCLRAQAID